MAAELRKLAHEFEEQLSKKDLHYSDIDFIINTPADLITRFARLYFSQLLSREETVDEIRKLFTLSINAALDVEKNDMKTAAERLGIETLTTDTHGSKTATALAETNIPWCSGVASKGLAVAVIHPHIGIAGSNRSAITMEDVMRFSNTVLDDPSITSRIPEPNITHFVTPDSLVELAEKTTTEALDEFSHISPDGLLPLVDNRVMVTGLDFLRKNQFNLINDAVITALKKHKALNNPKTAGRERSVRLDFILGESKGVIYGGITQNSTYRTPQFYNLR